MVSPEEFYVEYPFPQVLSPHPEMLKAFPRAELAPEQLSGLLQGFVLGARLSELSQASFIHRGEIRPFPDSKWTALTSGEGAALKPISEAAIRVRFKKWRELIFTGSESTAYYLEALRRNSTHLPLDHPIWESVVGFFANMGLYDDLDQEQTSAREEIWEEIQYCVRKCPGGLNTGKFKSKTNGHTYFQAALANWRVFLEQVEGRHAFQDELALHRSQCEASFEFLREGLRKKEKCGHCTRKFSMSFDMPMIQSIFEFVSRRRASSIKEFYLIFAHAVTVGLLQREIVLEMMEQSRSHSSWIIVPEAHRRAWFKNLYDIDERFQKCLSSAAHAIIDLELSAQSR